MTPSLYGRLLKNSTRSNSMKTYAIGLKVANTSPLSSCLNEESPDLTKQGQALLQTITRHNQPREHLSQKAVIVFFSPTVVPLTYNKQKKGSRSHKRDH